MLSDFFIRFVHLKNAFFLVPIFLIVLCLRTWWHKPVRYTYSLTQLFQSTAPTLFSAGRLFCKVIRFLALSILLFLSLQPQLVDLRSQITVDGIDMVLVLDVSGSMQFKDYGDQQKSRVEVAKEEAIRFVEKREYDAIGLVIFGNDAVSRCPITSDKNMLKKMIGDLHIGIVDSEGTVLARAIIAAANRLKQAKAKSKVMIVLTDGEPSEQDLDMSAAIKVARDLGIKIYTVGIGSETEEFFMHPLYGIVQKPRVNAKLLEAIAQQTGGQFFMAHNAHDMRTIYEKIDQLEKTTHDVPIYSKYYDLITPLGHVAFCLLAIELLLSSFVWFCL
jgi:Ca-activated chloride channel homolog